MCKRYINHITSEFLFFQYKNISANKILENNKEVTGWYIQYNVGKFVILCAEFHGLEPWWEQIWTDLHGGGNMWCDNPYWCL